MLQVQHLLPSTYKLSISEVFKLVHATALLRLCNILMASSSRAEMIGCVIPCRRSDGTRYIYKNTTKKLVNGYLETVHDGGFEKKRNWMFSNR